MRCPRGRPAGPGIPQLARRGGRPPRRGPRSGDPETPLPARGVSARRCGAATAASPSCRRGAEPALLTEIPVRSQCLNALSCTVRSSGEPPGPETEKFTGLARRGRRGSAGGGPGNWGAGRRGMGGGQLGGPGCGEMAEDQPPTRAPALSLSFLMKGVLWEAEPVGAGRTGRAATARGVCGAFHPPLRPPSSLGCRQPVCPALRSAARLCAHARGALLAPQPAPCRSLPPSPLPGQAATRGAGRGGVVLAAPPPPR